MPIGGDRFCSDLHLLGWLVNLGKKCISGMTKLVRVNEAGLALKDPYYSGSSIGITWKLIRNTES